MTSPNHEPGFAVNGEPATPEGLTNFVTLVETVLSEQPTKITKHYESDPVYGPFIYLEASYIEDPQGNRKNSDTVTVLQSGGESSYVLFFAEFNKNGEPANVADLPFDDIDPLSVALDSLMNSGEFDPEEEKEERQVIEAIADSVSFLGGNTSRRPTNFAGLIREAVDKRAFFENVSKTFERKLDNNRFVLTVSSHTARECYAAESQAEHAPALEIKYEDTHLGTITVFTRTSEGALTLRSLFTKDYEHRNNAQDDQIEEIMIEEFGIDIPGKLDIEDLSDAITAAALIKQS